MDFDGPLEDTSDMRLNGFQQVRGQVPGNENGFGAKVPQEEMLGDHEVTAPVLAGRSALQKPV